MHKFFHCARLKSTFSIVHTYFYKTLTSVCLLYIFIQIKYSFLCHTATDPHPQSTPESTQPTDRKPEKQTQQNGSKPTYQDRRLALSNKVDASGGDGENEKQERRFTSTPPMAMVRTRNKIDASKGKRWRWRW